LLDKFIQYHNIPISVSIHKDKKPLEFIVKTFEKDYELSDGNETDEQTYPFYKVEVKLLSDINDNDFKELTTTFIEDKIRKLLNIRMKLFSLDGECLVDLLYL
jgi:hypothetical protein